MIVSSVECYIFIQICLQLKSQNALELNQFGQFKIKKIRLTVSEQLIEEGQEEDLNVTSSFMGTQYERALSHLEGGQDSI